VGNPRTNSPQRFLELWEEFSGPLLDGPFQSDLELIKAIEVQEDALRAYATKRRFAKRRLATLRRQRDAGGHEHEVYVPENAKESGIVWKVTRSGRWGLVRATPREYLRRLDRLDKNSGTNIRVAGVALSENSVPLLVTSMAYIPGVHPNGHHLDRRLRDEGWELVNDPDQMQTYRLKSDGTLMRDAHPRNFVLTSGGYLVPIDVIFVGEGKFHTHG
jgi:hypothetical protein